MQASKQTFVIEHTTAPERSVRTTARWGPARVLEVTTETDVADPGGTAQTEVIHQVPEARLPELFARVGADLATVPGLIAWASVTTDRATALTDALAAMDPATLVFHRETRR